MYSSHKECMVSSFLPSDEEINSDIQGWRQYVKQLALLVDNANYQTPEDIARQLFDIYISNIYSHKVFNVTKVKVARSDATSTIVYDHDGIYIFYMYSNIPNIYCGKAIIDNVIVKVNNSPIFIGERHM